MPTQALRSAFRRPGPPSRRRRKIVEALTGYLFISPWIVGFIFLTGGPVLASFGISFFNWRLIEPPRFIGFENYVTMLTKDALFWKSVQVTLTYVVVAVPLQIVVALFLALLLNQKVRGVALWRTAFYLPSLVSGVALSVLFLWIYHPELGLLNQLLALIGVEGPAWLTSPDWALFSLIGMSVWGVGGPMVIFLAGLQNISQEMYEAADLDGAGEWTKFRFITLPMLSPVLFFNIVLGIIGGFQTFTTAFIMTKGGPINSTLFYGLYIYQNAFSYLKMGYASAMAWFMFIVIFVLTVIQFRLGRRWVYYEVE